MRLVTRTSCHSTPSSSAHSVKFRETSAKPSGLRVSAPLKITSAISSPRSDLADCSPRAQRTASSRLDFPQPFGPTMAVTPSWKLKIVLSANDLKPKRSSDCRSMSRPSLGIGARYNALEAVTSAFLQFEGVRRPAFHRMLGQGQVRVRYVYETGLALVTISRRTRKSKDATPRHTAVTANSFAVACARIQMITRTARTGISFAPGNMNGGPSPRTLHLVNCNAARQQRR